MSQRDLSAVALEIPDRVRRKAMTLGDAGVAWLLGLESLVRELASEWRLSLDRALSGGTASFVAEVKTETGEQAVLKIPLPGLDPTAGELRTLLAARGRGYCRVLRHDAARGALLLERLGCQLHELGLPVDSQIDVICATLLDAWAPLPAGARFVTGAEKARELAEFIETAWRNLGKPCSVQVIEMVGHYAAARIQAFDPATAVLAHGDPHAYNTLLVPAEKPRRFKFVDPDGLFIERAYDLGILMREWGTELLAGDPRLLGWRRCQRLARLTGLEPEPIWQWAFLERTSTGLLLLELGLGDEARKFFSIIEAWARSGVG
jgi:streptomycin 6-kinase